MFPILASTTENKEKRMRYGYCKEYSTPLKTEVDYELIKLIKEAGYDFVEMRAMLVASLSDEEFDYLENYLKELELDCDCCCALFPRDIRVTGKSVNYAQVSEYIEKIFTRCKRLGTKKIVFGSAPARALDEETTQDEGYEQIAELTKKVIVPACEKYGITVLIEPLRSAACNFIHTLSDGMRVVNAVNSPEIALLADTIHMRCNDDEPDDVLKYKDSLKHIHISELDRVLPEDGYSEYVQRVIDNAIANGYDGTISFETKRGDGLESMKKALALLKKQFNK